MVPFFMSLFPKANQSAVSWDHDDLFVYASYEQNEINVT